VVVHPDVRIAPAPARATKLTRLTTRRIGIA
jgi:hypothetical protein